MLKALNAAVVWRKWRRVDMMKVGRFGGRKMGCVGWSVTLTDRFTY
jgi:hypothetical protein